MCKMIQRVEADVWILTPFFAGRLDDIIPANSDPPLRATNELPRPMRQNQTTLTKATKKKRNYTTSLPLHVLPMKTAVSTGKCNSMNKILGSILLAF